MVDVADEKRLRLFADWISETYGEVNILICCASIQGPFGNALDIPSEEWVRNLEVNLLGTLNTIRAFWPLLRKGKASVFSFSGGGATNKRINLAPYACSKTAMVRLVEILAAEWEGQGVTINAIAPGSIYTNMTDELLLAGESLVGPMEIAYAEKTKACDIDTNTAKKRAVAECIECLHQHREINGKLISVPWDNWREKLDAFSDPEIGVLRRTIPKL